MRSSKTKHAALAFSAVAAAVLLGLIGVAMVQAFSASDAVGAFWRRHREACLQLPADLFHIDRARAVRGVVRGPDGKPVVGALVRCLPIAEMLRLTRSDSLTPNLWSNLVETETRTDAEGNYEFPRLSEGCRTLCVSAERFAPEVQSLVLVQDGAGARLDFKLTAPRTLRVRLIDADAGPRRIGVVPYRWWPELVSKDLAAGETLIEFPALGGPYEKGLICLFDPGAPLSKCRMKVPYDLNRSGEVTVSCTKEEDASPHDVPEAESVLSWGPEPSEASRQFFGMLTPLALLWRATPRDIAEHDIAEHAEQSRVADDAPRVLRGYGGGPFLPVLIESREGGAWLEWTSSASEFELSGVPAGLYRVRSMQTLGKVSFARGLVASSPGLNELKSVANRPIELDDPGSREVMGTVRWEDGRPAPRAIVFLQDTTDFRRYLQRQDTNENGYFTFADVPANGAYVAFAQPANDASAMKNFSYCTLGASPRESWIDLSLSPHRIVGTVPGGGGRRRVELLREEPGREPSVVWSVETDAKQRFEVGNVAHGRYLVRARGEGPAAADITSLACVIEKNVTVEVRWGD